MVLVLTDCDTGIDDALALTYLAALHHAGEIRLLGAMTTAGNVDARQTARNTRWVLDRCLLGDVPVLPGRSGPKQVPLVTTPETHGELGLGYVRPEGIEVAEGDWRELWRKALTDHDDLRLIITGPATPRPPRSGTAGWIRMPPSRFLPRPPNLSRCARSG